MGSKQKYYVVWNGVETGVFSTWKECEAVVKNFKGAKYKSFESKAEAEKAYQGSPDDYLSKRKSSIAFLQKDFRNMKGGPELESIAVDAACSGNPGKMEYRGVYVRSGEEIFHYGPVDEGTNNIGEFLAIVHGLALLKTKAPRMIIYSDSKIAQSWVKQKKCKTKLAPSEKNVELMKVVARAEKWLRENTYNNPILKWETSVWGEIPADFGRK